MESRDSGDLIPLAAARRDGSPERMDAADREKNGGTREVSHIQTHILHSDNRMGGVCVWF